MKNSPTEQTDFSSSLKHGSFWDHQCLNRNGALTPTAENGWVCDFVLCSVIGWRRLVRQPISWGSGDHAEGTASQCMSRATGLAGGQDVTVPFLVAAKRWGQLFAFKICLKDDFKIDILWLWPQRREPAWLTCSLGADVLHCSWCAEKHLSSGYSLAQRDYPTWPGSDSSNWVASGLCFTGSVISRAHVLRTQSTDPLRKGCRTRACLVGRQDSFGGSTQQHRSTCREVIEKIDPGSQQCVVRKQETTGIHWNWKSSLSLWGQEASESLPGEAVQPSSLDVLQGCAKRYALSTLVWPHGFTKETGQKSPPEVPAGLNYFMVLWRLSYVGFVVSNNAAFLLVGKILVSLLWKIVFYL